MKGKTSDCEDKEIYLFQNWYVFIAYPKDWTPLHQVNMAFSQNESV